MPARVVLAHADLTLVEGASGALAAAGYEVASFVDPMAALAALERAEKIELLITGVDFGKGKLHGIALANMARARRPDVRVLFVAQPQFREYVEIDRSEFLPHPIPISAVLEAVKGCLPI